jgi:hypothetical protein
LSAAAVLAVMVVRHLTAAVVVVQVVSSQAQA